MIFNLMKPVPVKEETTEWETVCEGTYTFEEVYGNFVDAEFALGVGGEKICNIELGDTIRISDSKKSWVVSTYPWGNQPTYILFGNTDLQESPEIKALGIDTDCDYAVNVNCGYLYAREAKTEYLKIERRVPVAYSYNGTVLPKLPEWDKTAYPYAYIVDIVFGYALYLFSAEGLIREIGGYDGLSAKSETCAVLCYDAYSSSPSWSFSKEYEVKITERFGIPLWCNRDLYNTDGSVYLSASEPVHVYELKES